MRLSPLLALPVLLSIAVSARAEEPKTYDLSPRAIYKSARS